MNMILIYAFCQEHTIGQLSCCFGCSVFFSTFFQFLGGGVDDATSIMNSRHICQNKRLFVHTFFPHVWAMKVSNGILSCGAINDVQFRGWCPCVKDFVVDLFFNCLYDPDSSSKSFFVVVFSDASRMVLIGRSYFFQLVCSCSWSRRGLRPWCAPEETEDELHRLVCWRHGLRRRRFRKVGPEGKRWAKFYAEPGRLGGKRC